MLFLVAGGYFFYEKVLNQAPVRAWDLVPASAVFVYEKDVCNACIDEIQKGSLWEIISRAAFHGAGPDSLKTKVTALLSARKGLLISTHITHKDDFDFVYYMLDAKNALQGISDLSGFQGSRYSERELSEVRIHEISDTNKRTLSWILIGDVWIGSFTPFLIEDVIRTHRGKKNFLATNPEIQGLPRISGDAGNLYIQLRNFSDWTGLFLPAGDRRYALGKSSLLDIKSVGDNVVLNGFSTDSARSGYLLSLFRNQSPVSFSLRNLVSNRTMVFTSYGINDGEAFSDALGRFTATHRRHLRDSLEKFSAGLSTPWRDLFGDISDEIGLCQLEGMSGQRVARILMMETKDPARWIGQFNELSERLSEDTVFYEKFADYTIREIPSGRLPEKLFWPLVVGFDHTYYTAYGNVIFMGDNLEELKDFLDDVANEDVWGKSVSKNQFLETTLLESNMSVFVNTPRVWNLIAPKLHDRWGGFVKDNQSLLGSIDMSAFQFSHLNNTYYTNITLNQAGEQNVTFATPARRNIVHLSQPVQRLHAGRSHVSQANEILIQDSLNDVTLVSMEGKVLWKIPVGDRITTEIAQIDYYNNEKLQYIFATHDAIHIVDRLGNYIPSYPLYLKGKNIRHLSVLDYDRSKRYRFLIAEHDGKLWMFDKTGKDLEGWMPNDAGGELLTAPRHHRIKGRDFIIAIRKDGPVNLYNRRGEPVKNFPLDIEGTPMGSYFLEMGRDIANTFFVVITRDGYRVKFNADGKIQSRETLLRAYVGSQFSLIPEKSGNSYLIMQHDRRQMTISDAAGKKIFANDYTSDDGSVKFYHYGAGKRFISFTDRVQELSYVFDGNGVLLTNPPLESTAIELSMANSDQSYVFFTHGKSLTIQPLNR